MAAIANGTIYTLNQLCSIIIATIIGKTVIITYNIIIERGLSK